MSIYNKERELSNCEVNASAVVVNAGAESLKEALRDVIPQELYELHAKGRLHIHDLEFYTTAYNCIGIEVADYAKDACDIHTALNRLFRGITELTNQQSGGIGVMNFDEGLARYLQDEKECELVQHMTDFLENLNLPLRKGCEKAYVTLNFGTGVSADSQRITSALLKAYDSGSYIFPNLVFCVKKGINRRATDPAHNMLREAAKVTAHRMNPTYLNLDSTFNRAMPPEKFGIMGCRSRIAENRFSEKGALHRGNIAAISINLVQLALESGNSMECFLRLIDIEMENAKEILLDRYEKLLKGSGLKYVQEHALYQGSEQSHAADMLKNGTLSIGFIGLWESFCVLHDDSSLLCAEDHKMLNVPFEVLQQYAQEGLQVVRHMREIVDLFAEATNMNFSLLASSGEGISGVLPKKTSHIYPTGTILQDLTYYTNSFHLPVYVNISAFEKIELEAPFHELCNGGHISYVELAEAPMANGEAIEDLVEYACENNIGYFGINYPLDECPCGYSGTFTVCPKCGRGGKDIKRLRRVSGYLSEENNMSFGKREELKHRRPNCGQVDYKGE